MKYLTIIILLFVISSAFSFDLKNLNDFSIGYYSVDGKNLMNSREKLFTDISFNSYFAGGIELDLLISENEYKQKNFYVYDRFKSYLTWNYESTTLSTSFSNTLFDNAKTNEIILTGLFDPVIKPVSKNSLTFAATHNQWNFNIDGAIRYRNLNYDYHLSEETEHENDLFIDLTLSRDIIEGLGAFTTIYYKNDLNDIPNSEIPDNFEINDPSKYYNELTLGGGVYWKKRFSNNQVIKVSTAYLHRDGETIPDYLTHYFITDVRYPYSLSPLLYGYISGISRGCYNEQDDKFYRVSNLIRAQLKYSLNPFDSRAYICAGFKYNPENKTDRYYGEVSYPIDRFLTLRVADYISPKYYNNVVTGIEYSFAKYNSIYLENTYSIVKSDVLALADNNELRLGTRIAF